MFLTRTVPALVPSDFHSSVSRVPSATKYSFLPTAVRNEGEEERARRLMSSTRTVPALVPFDFHSSVPWVPSSAEKNNFPPAAVKYFGTSP